MTTKNMGWSGLSEFWKNTLQIIMLVIVWSNLWWTWDIKIKVHLLWHLKQGREQVQHRQSEDIFTKRGHKCKWCMKKCAQVYQSEDNFSINTFKVRTNVYSKHMQNKVRTFLQSGFVAYCNNMYSAYRGGTEEYKPYPLFVLHVLAFPLLSSLWMCCC